MRDLFHDLNFSLKISPSIRFKHSTFFIYLNSYVYIECFIIRFTYLSIGPLSNLLPYHIFLKADIVSRTRCAELEVINLPSGANFGKLGDIETIGKYQLWLYGFQSLVHSSSISIYYFYVLFYRLLIHQS